MKPGGDKVLDMNHDDQSTPEPVGSRTRMSSFSIRGLYQSLEKTLPLEMEVRRDELASGGELCTLEC